jgi:RNase P subunit RPR2
LTRVIDGVLCCSWTRRATRKPAICAERRICLLLAGSRRSSSVHATARLAFEDHETTRSASGRSSKRCRVAERAVCRFNDVGCIMDSARMKHLWAAAHHMASVCPSASRGIMLELRDTAAGSGVALSRATADASCAACGTLATGIGVRTTTRRSSAGKAKGCVLRLRCDTCGTMRRRYVGKRPRPAASPSGDHTSASSSATVSSTATPQAKKVSRKKKKKAKSAAASGRGADQQGASLSLSDFLSSLK